MPAFPAGLSPVIHKRCADIDRKSKSWREAKHLRRSLIASGSRALEDDVDYNLAFQAQARSTPFRGATASIVAKAPVDPFNARRDEVAQMQRERFEEWKHAQAAKTEKQAVRRESGFMGRLRSMFSLRPRQAPPSPEPPRGDHDSSTDDCSTNVQVRTIRRVHGEELATARRMVERRAYDEAYEKKLMLEELARQKADDAALTADLEAQEDYYARNRYVAQPAPAPRAGKTGKVAPPKKPVTIAVTPKWAKARK